MIPVSLIGPETSQTVEYHTTNRWHCIIMVGKLGCRLNSRVWCCCTLEKGPSV